MTRINQIVLVPDKGATKIFGRFSEQEMIDGYVASLHEHLEEDRLAVRLHDQHSPFEPCSLVLHCMGGFDKVPGKGNANTTKIVYGAQESEALALIFQEALSDWGKCYADFHHKVSNPKQDDGIAIAGAISIGVSPFRINGPNAESYMTKLDELGKSIAHSLMEYLINRSEQPKMMKVEYK